MQKTYFLDRVKCPIRSLSISMCFYSGFVVQYAQEQEFFRQTALVSKKEKEKVIFDSYMYVYTIYNMTKCAIFLLINSIFNLLFNTP